MVDLDIKQLLPLNCMSADRYDHLDTLLTTTLVPLGATGALLLTPVVLKWNRSRKAAMEKRFVQAMLFAYPAISRTICQSFRCTSFDDGTGKGVQYLTADMSIDCDSSDYKAMVFYAILSLLVFSIGIPSLLFARLFKWRHQLNPPGYEDEGRAVKARMKKKRMLRDPIVR